MKYITGIHALNLPCNLQTCGDWHQSAIQWSYPYQKESKNSILGDYGIETNHIIPEHDETYNVANTIRACLDMMIEGKFSIIQGMNNDFVCNEDYDNEIFGQVLKLHDLPNWSQIDEFMKREYRLKWIKAKKEH